jgi:tRNA(Ile)-lysidine synthase
MMIGETHSKKIFLSLDDYTDIFDNKRILLAVSGGSDSMALLIGFNEWVKHKKHNIYFEAVTIDHGLRSSSTDEVFYVNEMCKKLDIKCVISRWEGGKPTSNIELLAREKRYSLIGEQYNNGKFDYLLTAHHMNDQAETFFIRLFRGSGIDGLASMDKITKLYDMNIVRPFLNLLKDDLRNYLIEQNIKWVEDESNNDEKYLRNKIRYFLNSFDNRNEIVERVNFAVEEINKAKCFIATEFEKYSNKLLDFNSFGTCLISYEKLKKINDDMRYRLMAHVAMRVSGNVYKPRFQKLKRLCDSIINLSENDIFRTTFYGCIFEKYGASHIMVYREYNSIGDDVKLVFSKEVLWDNRFRVKLQENREDLYLTHLKEGEFTTLLRETRKNDPLKYKKLREVVGIQKDIFYTLPIVRGENGYMLDFENINIKYI